MPTLVLKFKDNVVNEYHPQKGETLTIGRDLGNEIVIENLAVSGRHAKIDSVDDGFLLTDLKSTNGSFVNEQPISTHWLKHGDIISIGKHTLIFAYEEGEAKPEEDTGGDMDKTMIMDTASYREMAKKNLPENDAQASQEKEILGVLSYLAGGDGEVELSKKLIKIGKNPASDIVVSGLMVGQTAATISKRPNGYYVSHVGGMAKIKVNGEAVKETVLLTEFDNLEIGPIKMQLFYSKKDK